MKCSHFNECPNPVVHKQNWSSHINDSIKKKHLSYHSVDETIDVFLKYFLILSYSFGLAHQSSCPSAREQG